MIIIGLLSGNFMKSYASNNLEHPGILLFYEIQGVVSTKGLEDLFFIDSILSA
jgi:hypothetical protein